MPYGRRSTQYRRRIVHFPSIIAGSLGLLVMGDSSIGGVRVRATKHAVEVDGNWSLVGAQEVFDCAGHVCYDYCEQEIIKAKVC